MKTLPLPIDAICASQTLTTADAATLGGTMAILLAWWKSGCKPLPESEAGSAVLARCHSRRWYLVRDGVKSALSEIMPELTTMYARQSKVALARSQMARNAGVASAAARKRWVKPSVAQLHPADSLQSLMAQTIPSRLVPTFLGT
jgi:hypothetical protein